MPDRCGIISVHRDRVYFERLEAELAQLDVARVADRQHRRAGILGRRHEQAVRAAAGDRDVVAAVDRDCFAVGALQHTHFAAIRDQFDRGLHRRHIAERSLPVPDRDRAAAAGLAQRTEAMPAIMHRRHGLVVVVERPGDDRQRRQEDQRAHRRQTLLQRLRHDDIGRVRARGNGPILAEPAIVGKGDREPGAGERLRHIGREREIGGAIRPGAAGP